MGISKEHIVGEVVADNYKAASVFKENGIDFCCRGNRSIEDVCASNNLNADQLIDDLNTALATTHGGSEDYKSWPVDLLIDYIEKKHHTYVESKIAEIKPYLAKIVQVHGDENPELREIEKLFLESAGDLTLHMKKEEMILFPFVRKMADAAKKGNKLDRPHFDTVENPVAMMRHEHDDEGVRFRKIAALSDNYQPPATACNTYKVTFALLQEFENDLHLHIHLENNILFPQAIRMEEKWVA